MRKCCKLRKLQKFRIILLLTIVFSSTILVFLMNGVTSYRKSISTKSGSAQSKYVYNFDENTTSKNFVRPRFKFLKEPEKIWDIECQNNSCTDIRWFMVNFIKSSVKHFEHRSQLRSHWRDYYLEGGDHTVKFKNVFVVALDGNSTNQARLDGEHSRHRDILQMDTPELYRYVPLKTLAGMQWAYDNLPRHFLYSSGDDDVLINVANLRKTVDKVLTRMYANDWPHFPFICTYRATSRSKPYRHKDGKYKQWYISPREYKWPYYPRFCYGGFYTSKMDFMRRIYRLSRTVPYLRVDDVWITGILRLQTGMPDQMLLTPRLKVAVHGGGRTPDEVRRLEEKKKKPKPKKPDPLFMGVNLSDLSSSLQERAMRAMSARRYEKVQPPPPLPQL